MSISYWFAFILIYGVSATTGPHRRHAHLSPRVVQQLAEFTSSIQSASTSEALASKHYRHRRLRSQIDSVFDAESSKNEALSDAHDSRTAAHESADADGQVEANLTALSINLMSDSSNALTGCAFESPLPPGPPPVLKEIFMRYMPKHNTIVCGCAKCGTSSVYNYIFQQEFGQPWHYKGEPYIHEVVSPRWEGRFQVVIDLQQQASLMKNAYSFALIRDPKAWASKV